MISIEIEKETDSDWNKRLYPSKLGTVFQTQEYGSYFKAQYKSQHVFLKFYSANGELVGQIGGISIIFRMKKTSKTFWSRFHSFNNS